MTIEEIEAALKWKDYMGAISDDPPKMLLISRADTYVFPAEAVRVLLARIKELEKQLREAEAQYAGSAERRASTNIDSQSHPPIARERRDDP